MTKCGVEVVGKNGEFVTFYCAARERLWSQQVVGFAHDSPVVCSHDCPKIAMEERRG